MPHSTFNPGDLVTVHLPDGRKAEGRFWSHPRTDHVAVIDWTPRYGIDGFGRKVRQWTGSAGGHFVTIPDGAIVHAMSVRPCAHGAETFAASELPR